MSAARTRDGRDLRLVPPALTAWLVSALAANVAPAAALRGAAMGAVLSLGSFARAAWPRGSARSRAACAVASAALGVGAAAAAGVAWRAQARDAGPVPGWAQQRAEVIARLEVRDDPRPSRSRVVGVRRLPDSVVIEAALVDAVRGPVRVVTRQPVVVFASGLAWAGLLPGDRIEARGRLSPSHTATATLMARGPPRLLRRAGVIGRLAGRLRAGLRGAVIVLPQPERGLLPGLVVGDTSRLDPAVVADFRRAGLSHLIAVSGTNCAIVLAAALALARACRAGPRLAAGFAVGALVGFVVLARPSPSVLRAAVMGGLAMFAAVSGRERAGIRLLAAAVLGLVLADPSLARSWGFALSAAATAGILVLAPRWRAGFARRLPGPLADGLAVALAAQVATAPLVVALAGELSLVGVAANVVALPAVAMATLAGVGAMLAAPVAPALAQVAIWVAWLPTAWLVRVAEHAARVPGGQLGWPSGLLGAGLLGAALLGVMELTRHRNSRRALCVGLVSSCLALLAGHAMHPAWPPRGWRMVACEVGQGDALVLRGTSGEHVVVDAGPDPTLVDSCLRRLRVRRIAALVVTHLHADHVEGVPGVLRDRSVGQLVVGPLDEPADERERLLGWASERRIPTHQAVAGETWGFGAGQIDVLAPAAPFRGTDSDPNNSSLVMRISVPGLRLLLTGDVEQPAQEALLDAGHDLRADVLKVPHHGSNRQYAEFLAATGASVAVVSVGADNPYGHPAPGTLDSLRDLGMRAFRTDRDGDVALTSWTSGVAVTTRRWSGGRPPPRARPLGFPARPAPGAPWCLVRVAA